MRSPKLSFVLALVAVAFTACSVLAADLRINFPQERTAFQTNERIDVAVLRSSNEALAAGNLEMTLTGKQGSQMSFVFPVEAIAVDNNRAVQTVLLHINGRLLRPDDYLLEANADGATATAQIAVRSHIRKSTFKTFGWGSNAKGNERLVMGEDSLGFNMMYADGQTEDSILGGYDWMGCCTQGGGHQLALRLECDWSDPYSIRGGAAKASRTALQFRQWPNAIGVHLYDEPGLTWWTHPETGEWTPHGIPAQKRAYRSAFGKEMLEYYKVDPNDPEQVKTWMDWGKWKQVFMEANWRLDKFAVDYVDSDLITATQTQYGWSSFTDGYYFNIARQLPVVSGHGGYSNFWVGYFNPSFFLEMARARDIAKPCWYLPTWFRMPSDQFRLEQYLSFMTNIQGMATPPWITVHQPTTADASDGIVESNKLMLKVGTVFDTMPVTRPPVAMLFSLSNDLHEQALTLNSKQAREKGQIPRLQYTYLAGKMLHQQFLAVVDEDIVDGTLARNHKAVVLTHISYLDPKVVTALEKFAANGGLVMLTGDSTLNIKGAVKLNAKAEHFDPAKLAELEGQKDYSLVQAFTTVGKLMQSAAPMAKEIKSHLDNAGIKPVFDCDNTGIVATRQAEGDIEYLFAVNADFDDSLGAWNAFQATTASIGVPADGRPVYDPILSRPMDEFQKNGNELVGSFRFGPGQMRIFARTARPIGSVKALQPAVYEDYTLEKNPVRVNIGASLVDARGDVISGSAPLEIKIVDPLGYTRYDLYRATKLGAYRGEFQLAANDPAGEWTVVVRDLLAGTEDSKTFSYAPAAQCGALAGTERRMTFFGNDDDNAYRFFRLHRNVTIVTGKSAYNQAAAEWLAESLAPWDVKCEIVDVDAVNKPRMITEEEAPTWIGIVHTGRGTIKPGQENSVLQVGFAINKPVILLGNPDDNPMIAFLQKNGFLAYKPQKDVFPGRGSSYMAWERDGIYRGQEALCLIAYDAKGMAQAAGSLFEMASGFKPLTPWNMPAANSVDVTTEKYAPAPTASVVWQMDMPDRGAAMEAIAGNRLAVLTEDGTLAAVDANGKAAWQKTIDGGRVWCMDVAANGNVIFVGASQHVVAFDANGNQLFDAPSTDDNPAAVAQAVAVSADGTAFAVAADNGKLSVFNKAGQRQWSAYNGTEEKADSFTSVAFANNLVVALTAKMAKLYNTADGQVAAEVGGVTGVMDPIAVGDNLLLLTGNRRDARLLSPAEKKIVGQIKLPAAVADIAQTNGGFVIATEGDRAVRKVKAVNGNVQDQTEWSNEVIDRIPKSVAVNNVTAVAYWGGTVKTYAADGTLRTSQMLPQDVAAMNWLGNRLIVSLADGRIMGLEVR